MFQRSCSWSWEHFLGPSNARNRKASSVSPLLIHPGCWEYVVFKNAWLQSTPRSLRSFWLRFVCWRTSGSCFCCRSVFRAWAGNCHDDIPYGTLKWLLPRPSHRHLYYPILFQEGFLRMNCCCCWGNMVRWLLYCSRDKLLQQRCLCATQFSSTKMKFHE